jgi:hypothetical protein
VVRDVVVGAMIENFDGEAEFLKSWPKIIFGGGETSGPVLANRAGCQFFTPQSFQEIFGSGAKSEAREKGGMGHFSYLIYIWVLCPRLPSSE